VRAISLGRIHIRTTISVVFIFIVGVVIATSERFCKFAAAAAAAHGALGRAGADDAAVAIVARIHARSPPRRHCSFERINLDFFVSIFFFFFSFPAGGRDSICRIRIHSAFCGAFGLARYVRAFFAAGASIAIVRSQSRRPLCVFVVVRIILHIFFRIVFHIIFRLSFHIIFHIILRIIIICIIIFIIQFYWFFTGDRVLAGALCRTRCVRGAASVDGRAKHERVFGGAGDTGGCYLPSHLIWIDFSECADGDSVLCRKSISYTPDATQFPIYFCSFLNYVSSRRFCIVASLMKFFLLTLCLLFFIPQNSFLRHLGALTLSSPPSTLTLSTHSTSCLVSVADCLSSASLAQHITSHQNPFVCNQTMTNGANAAPTSASSSASAFSNIVFRNASLSSIPSPSSATSAVETLGSKHTSHSKTAFSSSPSLISPYGFSSFMSSSSLAPFAIEMIMSDHCPLFDLVDSDVAADYELTMSQSSTSSSSLASSSASASSTSSASSSSIADAVCSAFTGAALSAAVAFAPQILHCLLQPSHHQSHSHSPSQSQNKSNATGKTSAATEAATLVEQWTHRCLKPTLALFRLLSPPSLLPSAFAASPSSTSSALSQNSLSLPPPIAESWRQARAERDMERALDTILFALENTSPFVVSSSSSASPSLSSSSVKQFAPPRLSTSSATTSFSFAASLRRAQIEFQQSQTQTQRCRNQSINTSVMPVGKQVSMSLPTSQQQQPPSSVHACDDDQSTPPEFWIRSLDCATHLLALIQFMESINSHSTHSSSSSLSRFVATLCARVNATVHSIARRLARWHSHHCRISLLSGLDQVYLCVCAQKHNTFFHRCSYGLNFANV
jgi:hypothetical protein